jgi:enamine deaminase RidA (YjgF/YER057c/UK114 family)
MREEADVRLRVSTWLEREFYWLSAEAPSAATAEEETRALFQRLEQELGRHELGLEHVVRTRLWARDRESRDAGSAVRLEALSGRARSASSSYIAPVHFASDARVAVDLLALRPSRPGLEKTIKEYDPPIVPVRYIVRDGIVFFSGVTDVHPTLEEQVPLILERHSDSLRDAGSAWEQVVRVSCYLHRSQSPEHLKELLSKTVPKQMPSLVYEFVDGYSAPAKLVEIEVTATPRVGR